MSAKKIGGGNGITDTLMESTADTIAKDTKKYGIAFVLAAISIIIAAVVLGVHCLQLSISHGVENALDAYNESKENEYTEAYSHQYEHAHNVYEEKYHNSHEVMIRIVDIQKVSNLEVIKVVEEEVITQDPEDEKKGIKAWIKVSGTGVFTVDLSTAEFITNNELKYVKVLMFKPEMTSFGLDPIEPLFYADKKKTVLGIEFNNGTFEEGFDLFSKLRKKGYSAVRNAIANNQNYYEMAQDSAKIMVQNLVKNINSDVQNLVVDVEYFEDIESAKGD